MSAKQSLIVLSILGVAGLGMIISKVAAETGGLEYPQRKVATALEAYHVDYNAYPDWEYKSYGQQKIATFKATNLTTPTPYLPRMPIDIFSYDENHWYSYYCINAKQQGRQSGWILISPGPDKDYDISPVKDYDPNSTVILKILPTKHYDPTNGTLSSGDLFTIKP